MKEPWDRERDGSFSLTKLIKLVFKMSTGPLICKYNNETENFPSSNV